MSEHLRQEPKPWFAGLRERFEYHVGDGPSWITKDEGLALLSIAEAAAALIDHTIIDLLEVGRREMRLSQLLHHGPRPAHNQESLSE